jgi:uncharacterized protein
MTLARGLAAPLGRRIAALVLGAAFACAALAQDALVAVPKLTARVIDQTGTLTGPEQAQLEEKLRAFEAAKGSQVAVLLVPSIGPEVIEDFALRVTDEWKLGRKGVDDGVLFVIAKQQRKMRIHTGRGVQGTLTDAAAKRIVAERVAPAFRNGDFAGGINAGVEAILKAIEGEALPPPKAASSKPSGKVGTVTSASDFIWLAFFGVPVLAMFLRPMLGRALGATATGGITGVAAWLIFGSVVAGIVGAALAFVVAIATGVSGLRQGRRGNWSGGWIPTGGGWSGGGGGFGGGGFSGGGGGFDGGGASGDW